MRLICPNCGAQYEVPDEVIPQAGRDVQCSNCGDTWFQGPAGSEMAEDRDTGLGQFDEDIAAAQPSTPQTDETEDAGEVSAASAADQSKSMAAPGEDEDASWHKSEEWGDRDEDDTFADTEEENVGGLDITAVAAAAAPEPARRPIDPEVARVLREEAEIETNQRARETNPTLETQTDLGLDEPSSESARREREARQRMSRMRGLPDADLAPESASSRRDLLPDIEEINSSLRSTNDRRETERAEKANAPETLRRERNGFRLGFSIMLLIGAFLSLLYVYAEPLAERVPALETSLAAYINAIDGLRIWMDAQLTGLRDWLQKQAG